MKMRLQVYTHAISAAAASISIRFAVILKTARATRGCGGNRPHRDARAQPGKQDICTDRNRGLKLQLHLYVGRALGNLIEVKAMKQIAFGTLVAVTALTGCQQVTDDRIEADISAIRNQLDEFEAVLLSPDVSTPVQIQNYLEFFGDDPVVFPPEDDSVHGYDAVLAFYTAGFAGGTFLSVDYHTHVPEIFVQGDIAIRRYIGSSEAKFEGELELYSSNNRYIDILRRQADGEWRVIWHAWYPVDP